MPRHRGRKRKPGARNAPTTGRPYGRPQRTGNTALPQSPLPPEEIRARRLALFGDEKAPGMCTEAPLDVLMARRLITEQEYQAGWTYAVLAWLRAGRPFAASQMMALLSSAAPADWLPPDERRATIRYTLAVAALQSAGQAAMRAVVDVAQHQQGTERSLADLVAGLGALTRHFEQEPKLLRAALAA